LRTRNGTLPRVRRSAARSFCSENATSVRTFTVQLGAKPASSLTNSKEMFRTHGPDSDCANYVLSTHDTLTDFFYFSDA